MAFSAVMETTCAFPVTVTTSSSYSNRSKYPNPVHTASEAVVMELETSAGSTRCDLEPGETCWDVWLASWRDWGSNPLVVWRSAGGANADAAGGFEYRVPALPIGVYSVVCADEASGRACAPEP